MTDKKQQVAKEILEYLVEHDGAKDTIEGIMWWRLERAIKRQMELQKKQGVLVEQALKKLVERELVLASQGPDSRTYYELNKKNPEVEKLLNRKKRKAGHELKSLDGGSDG